MMPILKSNNIMKTIGVLGGLDPEASGQFYMNVVKKSVQVFPSQFPCLLIYNIPIKLADGELMRKEPDDKEGKILGYIAEGLRRLSAGGADFIVIPCNTAHLAYARYAELSFPIPILSIIDVTVKALKEQQKAGCLGCVALLGTAVTVKNGLFSEPMSIAGISFILSGDDILDLLMKIIDMTVLESYCEKIEQKRQLRSIICELKAKGATDILLACTELPLIIKQEDHPEIRIISTMDLLESAVVALSLS